MNHIISANKAVGLIKRWNECNECFPLWERFCTRWRARV